VSAKVRYVLANWKMHKGQADAEAWARAVAATLAPSDRRVAVVLPPFTALAAVRSYVGDALALGAQDVYPQPSGAVTGGVGTDQLRDLGVRFVLCGHSERRRLLGEDDGQVARKVQAVLDAGMTPVVCVGEDQEERENGHADHVVRRQVSGAIEGVAAERLAEVVWAYEPVWAIGSGRPATPEQASEAAAILRHALRSRLGADLEPASVAVLYGGSVAPENVAAYARAPGVDGALVGGASLDASAFVELVRAVEA
jgi:triosephosphate isomerase